MDAAVKMEEPGAFWSDDFDMDLFKALPAAREWVKPIAAVPLYTFGNLTNGRLNHPDVWNHSDGMISWWGTTPSGFKPEFYSTGGTKPVVATNGEDAMRDMWAHGTLMMLNGQRIWNSEILWPSFEAMMWRMRGWGEMEHWPQDECEHVCELEITRAVERIAAIAA